MSEKPKSTTHKASQTLISLYQPIDLVDIQTSSYSPLIEVNPEITFNFPILNMTTFQPYSKITTKEFERIIIETIKKEDILPIQCKIIFTYYILVNSYHFNDLKEFYEEECHLSLLNWVWELKDIIKSPCMSNQSMNDLNFILELLYNILNIFELLHIKTNDILDLKLLEKLNKIKRILKKRNFTSFFVEKIDTMLSIWEEQIDKDKYNNKEYLTKKRSRNRVNLNEDETEADSDEFININGHKIKNIESRYIQKKKRKIPINKVTINLERNTIVYYDKESEPIKVKNITKTECN